MMSTYKLMSGVFCDCFLIGPLCLHQEGLCFLHITPGIISNGSLVLHITIQDSLGHSDWKRNHILRRRRSDRRGLVTLEGICVREMRIWNPFR
jgi:hypothetical protein